MEETIYLYTDDEDEPLREYIIKGNIIKKASN